MKPSKWKTLRSERVYHTPIFELHRRRRQHPVRGRRDFFVLQAPDWVNIIPLTAAGEVVMVRQYRHGTGALTLEIPGGMVDPADADPRSAARREMIEECGYDSADVIALGVVHPNPALQPNRCFSFLARNVVRVARPAQQGAEETEVVTFPLAQIKGLIAQGAISHALVIAAFAFFQLYNPPARAGRAKTPAAARGGLSHAPK